MLWFALLQLARNHKIEKYTPLVNVLVQLGCNVKLHVSCFGSLANSTKECGGRSKAKNVLKWCSISNIIGANYIWRNRVKKLLVRWNNNFLVLFCFSFFFQFASLGVISWYHFVCMNVCFFIGTWEIRYIFRMLLEFAASLSFCV